MNATLVSLRDLNLRLDGGATEEVSSSGSRDLLRRLRLPSPRFAAESLGRSGELHTRTQTWLASRNEKKQKRKRKKDRIPRIYLIVYVASRMLLRSRRNLGKGGGEKAEAVVMQWEAETEERISLAPGAVDASRRVLASQSIKPRLGIVAWHLHYERNASIQASCWV